MPSEVKTLVSQAQAAEVRGDKPEAVALLRRAAQLYRDLNNGNQALRMLRHARRLEGIPAPDDEEGPLAAAPSTLASTAWNMEQHDDDGRALEEEVRSGRRRVLEERGAALSDPGLEAWCSFCCKPNLEVGQLVAGPAGAYLCRACVEVAAGLLAGASERSAGSGPQPQPGRGAPALEAKPERRSTPNAASSPAQPSNGAVASSAAVPSRSAAPSKAAALAPHLRAHALRLEERAPRLTLVIGPPRSGKSTLLGALAQGAEVLTFELDAVEPLALEQRVLEHLHQSPKHRAVVAARGAPPAPALLVEGAHGPEAIYDTASLSAALDRGLSEALLERVDGVVTLEPFDTAALEALARALLEDKGATLAAQALGTLVAIAQRAARPLDELVALVGRVPRVRR